MAGYTISNVPDYIPYQAFRAAVNRQGEFARTSRYAVRILPAGAKLLQWADPFLRDLVFATEATELPARGLEHGTFRYYGPEFHLPIRSVFTELPIQFYCRQESFERQFFDDWMDLINPPSTYDFSYKDDYKAEIEIFQFADFAETEDGETPKAIYSWTLHGCWPTLVAAQPVNWADGNFLRLNVTFSYQSWKRHGRSPEPSTYQLVKGRPSPTTGGNTIV